MPCSNNAPAQAAPASKPKMHQKNSHRRHEGSEHENFGIDNLSDSGDLLPGIIPPQGQRIHADQNAQDMQEEEESGTNEDQLADDDKDDDADGHGGQSTDVNIASMSRM